MTDLNGYSGFGLGVFVIVGFLVIRPVYLPVPILLRRWLVQVLVTVRVISSSQTDAWFQHFRTFPLSLETAPPIAVLLLLATTAINGETIKLGIVGQGDIVPYNVLVLFICLAYIAISLDTTGALRSLAFYISQRGGKSQSGNMLYLLLYLFFFSFGMIVGNDPIILSGTAFLAYFTRVTGLDPPHPWIFAEFLAANTASAVLVPSNPTNVLIAGGFQLNFLTGFTKYTILPSVIPAMVTYPILFGMFKRAYPQSLPLRLVPPDVDPRSALVDPSGAVFHTVLMLVTLATLVGTSFVPPRGVPVWQVTLPAGVLALSRDLVTDYLRCHPRLSPRHLKTDVDPDCDDHGQTEACTQNDAPYPPPTVVQPTVAQKQQHMSLEERLQRFAHRFPITCTTVSRLPIPLLPFAMAEFILVRALDKFGWIDLFGKGFARACTSPTSTVFFMGYVTTFLCPLCGTNIGTTILMVEILKTSHFSNMDETTMKAAIYAVALGSNLGAFSFAFTGSLAGLLWRNLLKQKGIIVKGREFAKWNMVPVLLQTTLACAIILLEVYHF